MSMVRMAQGAWYGLSCPTRRLLLARFWRSLSQGALVVDLTLYLHALGWSGAAIGMVLSAAGLLGAALSLVVGVTSDRLRRKPFLLAYEGITSVCALVAMTQSSPYLLAPAIVLAGFGRGANGAAGPFSPAEQAWLAEAVAPPLRGFVYSLNTAVGFVGMALGAGTAALPAWLRPALGEVGSFRPLFGLVLVGNAINLLLLSRTPERPSARVEDDSKEGAAWATVQARENRFLWRLVALNMLNGVAVGLTGPLISYWFALRFHIGPRAIGPIMAAAFAATAVSAMVMARLTRRLGLVRSVVLGRTGGLLLLVLMPLAPAYTLAALAYLLRSALNRGTLGARQALVVSVMRDRRRGFASSMNSLSMQLPMALGPSIAGIMIGAGRFALPFFIAAGLQGLYVLLYGRLFPAFERVALHAEEE